MDRWMCDKRPPDKRVTSHLRMETNFCLVWYSLIYLWRETTSFERLFFGGVQGSLLLQSPCINACVYLCTCMHMHMPAYTRVHVRAQTDRQTHTCLSGVTACVWGCSKLSGRWPTLQSLTEWEASMAAECVLKCGLMLNVWSVIPFDFLTCANRDEAGWCYSLSCPRSFFLTVCFSENVKCLIVAIQVDWYLNAYQDCSTCKYPY